MSLKKSQLDGYRSKLQEELAKIQRKGRLEVERFADVSDTAVQNHGLAIEASEERLSRDKEEAIRAAIHRIDDGEYGICQECSEPIAKKRLTAQPEATFCTSCQEGQEKEASWEPRFQDAQAW
ncbi:MAG: TraR/DksA family transcriptional regulator [bacterium]|nr:TraR/DksA family transcriptional regulator [bacterium]